MYVGRTLVIGQSECGELLLGYLLYSKTHKNRIIKNVENGFRVALINGVDESRVLEYECIRLLNEHLVVGNGIHVKVIEEKLKNGENMFNAVSKGLIEVGAISDKYDSARVTAVTNSKEIVMGVISKEKFKVEKLPLNSGILYYLSAYNLTRPGKHWIKTNICGLNEFASFLKHGYPFNMFEEFVSTVVVSKTDKELKWDIITSK
ncbi:MAG: IMP cyclohydrolase [Candidatus Odinarchaeia archaeon]